MTRPLLLVLICGFALALPLGCTKSSTSSQSGGTTSTSMLAGGDATHGKQLFTQNCASCHGATGTEGGVGPSLRNEKSRKNFAKAVTWIENPQPPMPKLYPSPLSEKDVDDVAAYVETL